MLAGLPAYLPRLQFVKLLQKAPNGVIDLKTAADMLAVRQKVCL
jgi:hypothetical protein